MSTSLYQQCRLRRQNSEQVSFLPLRFAVAGRVVRLKQEDASWEDGWLIADVYGMPTPLDQIHDPHAAVKSHRRATGDSATRAKS